MAVDLRTPGRCSRPGRLITRKKSCSPILAISIPSLIFSEKVLQSLVTVIRHPGDQMDSAFMPELQCASSASDDGLLYPQIDASRCKDKNAEPEPTSSAAGHVPTPSG